jgi:4-hydroxybenzoate polyprenyltransferase/phosphoserine phosphatase
MNQPPLVIDLDGTLLRTDLLFESALGLLRAQPLLAPAMLWWLADGKATLKQRLAETVELDVASLPYDARVLELIARERAQGRQIVLATASHRIYAEQVAAHLGLFDRVLASETGANLSSHNKRGRLIAEFGERGFDYAGNSYDDIPVWAAAQHAYVVNCARGVEARAKVMANVKQVIALEHSRYRAFFRALRLHQWAKNLLLFVPLLAGHKLGQPGWVLEGSAAFVCFGLCASSVYLLNDMLDLNDDRHHPGKRTRALAAGELPLKAGLVAAPLLLLAAFAGAVWLLPWQFAATLAVYYLLTLAYSISLKRRIMADVIVLAALYTLRVIAGTFAFAASLTFWLLTFCMFIFLSLALVKRYAELREAAAAGEPGRPRGRGYTPGDLEMIAAMGAASGYLSVMVLALYIQDQATVALYRYPSVIWLACPLLLYWISRTWLITHRGQMHEDPVLFAIKDRVSLLVGALFGAVFWLAT